MNTNEVMKPAPFNLDVQVIDGEARVLDTDLAAQLGMVNERAIRRDLIANHRDELETYGSLAEAPTNPGTKGGRPGTAFYLNKHQALLICILSKTPRAREVRAEVIRRFGAYEAPGMDQLMGAMTAPEQAPLVNSLIQIFDAKSIRRDTG